MQTLTQKIYNQSGHWVGNEIYNDWTGETSQDFFNDPFIGQPVLCPWTGKQIGFVTAYEMENIEGAADRIYQDYVQSVFDKFERATTQDNVDSVRLLLESYDKTNLLIACAITGIEI